MAVEKVEILQFGAEVKKITDRSGPPEAGPGRRRSAQETCGAARSGLARRTLPAAALACALVGAAGCAGGQAGAAHGMTPRPGQAMAALTAPTAPAPPPTEHKKTFPPRRLPLAGDVIVLDPGHDGGNAAHPAIINQLVNVITEQKACDTAGAATDAGYAEHTFNFDVAIRVARLLRIDGATVVLTRHTDSGVGPCVTERAAIGNRAHANAAISIHADGGPPGGSGFEVIQPGLEPGYTNKIVGPSRRLGLDIRNEYRAITGEPYSDYIGTAGLDVRTDLGGLNLSTVPKVFIECANMRNSSDAAHLTNAAFRQRIAVALSAGLSAFLHGH
jgi:N-acetylmuramoyl-L-alanine amidase